MLLVQSESEAERRTRLQLAWDQAWSGMFPCSESCCLRIAPLRPWLLEIAYSAGHVDGSYVRPTNWTIDQIARKFGTVQNT